MTDESYEKGQKLLNKMFGKVAERIAMDTTDFDRPLSDYATRTCFGDVWQRPGLDHKTRSMLTLAMLTALGQQNQIKAHVIGAISNGVTREEIQEILVHSIIYCGLPRAVDAFGAAKEVLANMDLE
jgi:4-carboxymuconolactone decarboxylase